MNRGIVFNMLLLLSILILPAQSDAGKITVYSQEKTAKISPLFWGTNFLFWIEDDKALADGQIVKMLKDMECPVLRYPGGTVADNFHWKTGRLDNTSLFPYESGEEETDFDEFMVACKKIGAEPLLVVNTQSWFLKRDIEGGAKDAADWVRYCKEKGYKVKYWEIGNETYWHSVMTAKEYARLVNVYAKAMKEADPTILVSANGHWDINLTGNKERTPKEYWDTVRETMLSLDSKSNSTKFKKELEELIEKDVTCGEDKWWNDVADICGENIDMISIHWYYYKQKQKMLTPKIKEVKELFRKKFPNKKFLVCLSEYNCNEKDATERILGFAEGIGRFLEAGIDIGNFWPMRIGGMENRSMFNIRTNAPQYPYTILKMFARDLKGNLVNCSQIKGCHTFASNNGKEMTIVISGRELKKEEKVLLDIKDFIFKEITCGKFTVVESPYPDVRGVQHSLERVGQDLQVSVSPDSFIMLKLVSF